jgi:glycosyltransferase involved in cell wall biosynthesis
VSRISAIIPLYNKEATVRRTLNSILTQTLRDVEVVVVDDGSTDKSVEQVLKVSDERIRLIRQKNAGPGAARNTGASQAQSPLLAFLDADDEWTEQFLKRAAAALDAHPECAAFVAAYDTGAEFQHVQRNKLLDIGVPEGPWRLDPATPANQIKRYVDACHSSCVVVRREVFNSLGGFFGLHHCKFGEDSYLWLQLVLTKTIYWCPQVLVKFHVEDSALGAKLTGRHPMRPALTHPERLRSNCGGPAAPALERLLAHYRMLEADRLAREGSLGEIIRLRRLYPGAESVKNRFWRERRLELRALLHLGRRRLGSSVNRV